MDWVRLGVRYFFDPKIRGMGGDLADAAEVTGAIVPVKEDDR